jgi:hypothetical protein
MQKLGASVTPLPTPSLFAWKSVIDFADRVGLTANFDAGLTSGKYIIQPGFHQPTTATCYVANNAAWNKLPDDLKAIVGLSVGIFGGNFQQNGSRITSLGNSAKGREVIYSTDEEVQKDTHLCHIGVDNKAPREKKPAMCSIRTRRG